MLTCFKADVNSIFEEQVLYLFSDSLGLQNINKALMEGLVLMLAQYSSSLEEPPLRNRTLQNVTEKPNNTTLDLGAVALPFHRVGIAA